MQESDKERLINEFTLKYGNKYTYFPETISGRSTKMKIACDCGNVYYKTPYNHLRYGCRLCGYEKSKQSRTMSFSEFQIKVEVQFGARFDLSKAVFINATTKVEVGCPIHGYFWQTPSELFRGTGCHKCANCYRKTQEEYIESIKIVHGDKYDTSMTVFTGMGNRIQVKCKEHGIFTIKANNFLAGSNCPKCARITAIEKTTYDKDKWISKFKEVHGDKYDYSKFNPVHSQIKCTIICPIHGEFEQTPTGHSVGGGCEACGRITAAKAASKLPEEKFDYFFTKAKEVHGYKFEYFPDSYEDYAVKTKIKCKNKGHVFYQLPSSHLRGIGCPYCNLSKGEEFITEVLKNSNLDFKRQFSVTDSTTLRTFRYDFFLPVHNIFIEFHGRQHFEPVDYFGGIIGFEKTVERDDKKIKLAAKNKIPLIIFNHNHLRLPSEEFKDLIISSIKMVYHNPLKTKFLYKIHD